MQVNLDIIKVIMLEVAESVEMKVDEYRHDFRLAHSPFPIGQGLKLLSCNIGILGRLCPTSTLILSISLMEA